MSYKASGSGRDSFIFDDDFFKFGNHGRELQTKQRKEDFQLEFWQKIVKKTENQEEIKKPPEKQQQERKKTEEVTGRKRTYQYFNSRIESSLKEDEMNITPACGYTGHVPLWRARINSHH